MFPEKRVSRKKHHAKQTACEGKDDARAGPCGPRHATEPGKAAWCSAARAPQAVDDCVNNPCRPPQMMRNERPAPCHRPPSIMVIIKFTAERAVPVSAERDVEIIAQKTQERQVPAAPEILHRRGEVGPVEIFGPAEPEPEPEAARDVRVAGEIEINLQRVEPDVGERPDPRGVWGGDIREEGIDRRGDAIGNDQLFEIAARDEEASSPAARAGAGAARRGRDGREIRAPAGSAPRRGGERTP